MGRLGGDAPDVPRRGAPRTDWCAAASSPDRRAVARASTPVPESAGYPLCPARGRLASTGVLPLGPMSGVSARTHETYSPVADLNVVTPMSSTARSTSGMIVLGHEMRPAGLDCRDLYDFYADVGIKIISGGTSSLAICPSGCTPLSARRCGMRGTSIRQTVRRGCSSGWPGRWSTTTPVRRRPSGRDWTRR